MFRTEIICDKCYASLSTLNIETKGLMIRLARKKGWSIGKYHLCPDCRKKLYDKQ